VETIPSPRLGFLRRVFLANHLASTDKLIRTSKRQNTYQHKITIHKSDSIKQHTQKTIQTERQEPGLVAFYNIRPGNGAGQFLQTRSLHEADGHKEYLACKQISCQPSPKILLLQTFGGPSVTCSNLPKNKQVRQNLKTVAVVIVVVLCITDLCLWDCSCRFWQAVVWTSFDKHGLILIIFWPSAHFQQRRASQLSLSLHFYFLYLLRYSSDRNDVTQHTHTPF